jgi:hypothetical protein
MHVTSGIIQGYPYLTFAFIIQLWDKSDSYGNTASRIHIILSTRCLMTIHVSSFLVLFPNIGKDGVNRFNILVILER